MTRRPRPGETLGEFPPITGESVRSRNYEAGRAVRYSGRIHGPTFPVETYSVDDLPDDSSLRSAEAIWDRAITESPTETKFADLHSDSHLGHGKASE